ncbi:MAG: c-type cytochrome [Anaerolineales bacterium]|nr:c-type cytochrome [Anaerolineales bacterium]
MLSTFTHRHRWFWLFGAALLLAGCIQTSAEPEIVSTRILSPVPTTVALDANNVPASFDLDAGRSIFETQCATCHGETGDGDGPTTVSIECEMPVFALREETVTLSDWFLSIANGTRIPPDPTCPMPFWRNTLTQAQMWNVAAYVYQFGPNGDTIVAANPAPQSTEEVTDETLEPTQAVPPSTEETPAPTQIIADETPAPTVIEPVATEEVEDSATATPATTFTLIGAVSNGTTGEPLTGEIPLSVFIVGLDTSGNPQDLYEAETTLDENMTYTFVDVPLVRGILSVQVTYAGINQYSDFLLLPNDITSTTHSMDITVYETTTSDSNIVIRSSESLVDAVTSEGSSLIYQTFEYVNTGDRAYIGDNGLTIKVPFPSNAANPAINSLGSDSTRFALEGNTFRDTFPLLPGESNAITLEISYNVRYSGSMTVQQTFPYTVESLGVFTYQARALEITSEQLSPAGTVTANSNVYEGKQTTAPLSAGSSITYTIRDTSNTPSSTVSNTTTTQTADDDTSPSLLQDNANLILGIGVLLIVAGGMYLIYDLQKTRILAQTSQAKVTHGTHQSKDDLLSEIAELDDAFERGELKEEYYEQQRAALKEKLRRYF